MSSPQRLETVIENLKTDESDTAPSEISIGELLSGYGERAYGPLLLIPAFIAVAPTGAIPGMSILTGALILIIGAQMVVNCRAPWFPSRVTSYRFSRARLDSAVVLARPFARWIDTFIKPRLAFMTGSIGLRLVGVVSIGLALTMFPLALLPFAVALPGSALFLLGLGVTARDGLIVGLGYTLAITAFVLPTVWAL